MEIKPPPPLVSAYSVMELQVLNHPTTGIPYLAHKESRGGKVAERYINTIDITTQYLMKGLFIVGWQEFHYEIYYDNAGAPRFREITVTRTHDENQARILKLKTTWDEYYKHSNEAFIVPGMLSLEQELNAAGWQFDYLAGHGPLYNPDMEPKINWAIKQAEMIADEEEESVPFKGFYHLPDDEAPLPPKEDGLNRLESKIDVLTSSIGSLVEVLSKNANGHDPGTSQLRVSKPTPKHRKQHNKRARSSANTDGVELGV